MLTAIAILALYLLALVPLAYLWVSGIDNMKDKHPDYKGEGSLED